MDDPHIYASASFGTGSKENSKCYIVGGDDHDTAAEPCSSGWNRAEDLVDLEQEYHTLGDWSTVDYSGHRHCGPRTWVQHTISTEMQRDRPF